MPAVVNHTIKLFADDIKLIGMIENNNDLELVQKGLECINVLGKRKWRMLFHPDNRKIMNISMNREDTKKSSRS